MNEIRKCPFCNEGEMHPTKGGYIYWQRYKRGYRRTSLQALECNKCGIIVFKKGDPEKWSKS